MELFAERLPKQEPRKHGPAFNRLWPPVAVYTTCLRKCPPKQQKRIVIDRTVQIERKKNVFLGHDDETIIG
jgi:hypothetical protein